jgi:LmbE family N-acetylglucosaminyl deacetylase
MSKTILGIGAHYDDCVFGIPGILLKSIRKNYRVVILTMIGNYTNWKPVKGREQELIEGSIRISGEYGVEMQFLDFTGMRFDVNLDTKRAVATAVANIQPDIAFMLWPHDRHPDHEVASKLSNIAIKQADRMFDEEIKFRPVRQAYWYDNGPGHTLDFEPNTFVDVSDEWPQAMEWLGRQMALMRNVKYEGMAQDAAQRSKEILAAYRGLSCGVRYAEALCAVNALPQEIL